MTQPHRPAEAALPAPDRPTRWKEIARNLLLSAASTIFFFVCLETILRLAELAPTQALAYPDAETWARSPGPFDPNQDFVDRFRPRLPHRIRINSLGFRGPELPLEKATGTIRILCLGDSYMFGDYVNDDETFPAALERLMRRATGGPEIETVNAGVNGYTITDETDLAREKGMSLQPDLVIVGFVLNDLADLTRRVSSRENQRHEAEVMSSSPLTPVKDALRRTATYNFLFVLKASILARTGGDPTIQALPIDHLLHPPFDAATDALFARYEEELAKLAEICRRNGARLLLVLFPFYEQVVKDAPADAQARMAEIAARAGVPVVDLLPVFRASGSRAGRLFLMPLDHHPSATGYRVAAREVSRVEGAWIREKRAALDAPR